MGNGDRTDTLPGQGQMPVIEYKMSLNIMWALCLEQMSAGH
jgi:hypothetical protein